MNEANRIYTGVNNSQVGNQAGESLRASNELGKKKKRRFKIRDSKKLNNKKVVKNRFKRVSLPWIDYFWSNLFEYCLPYPFPQFLIDL